MKVEDIDRFIDRWRATLTPAFTPEYVDGFMRRHRGELHALVVKTLARRGAEGGEAQPVTVTRKAATLGGLLGLLSLAAWPRRN